MASYNGHRSWAYWNVSLWINNDEGLYCFARDCLRRSRTRKQAAERMLEMLQDSYEGRGKPAATPDGAVYSVDKIVAAMRGMEG